jgi:hypothetical protein
LSTFGRLVLDALEVFQIIHEGHEACEGYFVAFAGFVDNGLVMGALRFRRRADKNPHKRNEFRFTGGDFQGDFRRSLGIEIEL